MSPRVLTLLVGALIATGLAVTAAVVPVPYVQLAPGPTFNTLGTNPQGEPIITIRDHRTYPTTGHLNLLTVAVSGGPPSPIRLGTALSGWWDNSIAIVPQSVIYPPGINPQEVEQSDILDMLQSQDDAARAALTMLGYHISTQVRVELLVKGGPASTALQQGDVILDVDHHPTPTAERLRQLLAQHKPGTTALITYRRDGHVHSASLRTVSEGGRAVIGVFVRDAAKLPFPIDINLAGVEGPSAGLMLALGIYDKLTPGTLTAGHFVAGTGTIDSSGEVGPIGGIQQKIVAAERAGADTFLVPADNCSDAKSVANKHILLVRVKAFRDALSDLAQVRAGANNVPTC